MVFVPKSEKSFASATHQDIHSWVLSNATAPEREALRKGWPTREAAVNYAARMFVEIKEQEAIFKKYPTDEKLSAYFEEQMKKHVKEVPGFAEEDEPEEVESAESVAASWEDPAVHAARTTRNHVIVSHGGESATFRSVRAAFEELELPMEKHIKFRTKMKKVGRMPFDWAGVEYIFEVKQR